MADPKLKLGNDIWATKQKSLLAYNDEGGNYKSLPFQVDRISGGTYVGRNGLIQYAASNEPRIDFLNNTKGGLLLEPQRTNQILYSEDFTNAVWQKLGGGTGVAPVVTANYSTAPNGSNTADRVVLDMGSNTSINDYSIIRNFGTSGSTGTNSVYIKSNTSDSYTLGIDNTGQVETITVTPQWQRFSYSVTNSDRLQISLRGGGQTVSAYADVSMWGGSLENGTYVTSYIPTSSAAVTRVQDYIAKGGNEYIFNDSEGVLYAEIQALANDQTYRFISISDNSTSSNRVVISYNTTSNQIRCDLIVGGSTQSAFSTNSYDITQKNKVAIKYKLNDVKMFANGLQVGSTDTSANVFPSGTLNQINFDNGNLGSTFYFEGFLNDLQYFDEALSDAELATLTTL